MTSDRCEWRLEHEADETGIYCRHCSRVVDNDEPMVTAPVPNDEPLGSWLAASPLCQLCFIEPRSGREASTMCARCEEEQRAGWNLRR